ncbi:hypothetical protein [Xenorhabdus bovienii]|uniref:phage tail fiber protein n=1 Tax=Xenorhabdus bovienii TaxID=40576 RepID=UPI0023B264FD|nr:hypothetical protein [Xenorhabdus bovienii]
MIYSDGTTNLVSGSAIVRGTGTKWKSNINGIAAGQIISIQSGNTVIQNVIRSVNSDTELVLAFAPSVNLNNAKYVISTTVPDTVSDGVRHICAINAYIILFLQNMDRWMSENGKVEVEMPNGQKVTLDSIRALQAGVEGKLVKEQNGADIPNKPEFVKNLGLAETQDLVKKSLSLDSVTVGGNKKARMSIGGNDIYIHNSASGAYLQLKDDGRLQYQNTDVIKQRDHGIGSSDLVSTNHAPSLWNVSGDQPTGFYGYSPDSDKREVWGSFIKLRWNAGNQQYLIFPNFGDNAMRIVRFSGGNSWIDHTVWTTGNATFDGNGFLKKTSPIIQIYPDGHFITNDESEGATVTKLGLGHYKLSGILGYNADGAWGVHGGISVPRDVNGNELVYVEDKVLPDGAIEIRVTHRQNAHMPARLQNRRMKSVDEQTHYTDDEACDLPAGTRLDVRVQMPEDSVWNVRGKSL